MIPALIISAIGISPNIHGWQQFFLTVCLVILNDFIVNFIDIFFNPAVDFDQGQILLAHLF